MTFAPNSINVGSGSLAVIKSLTQISLLSGGKPPSDVHFQGPMQISAGDFRIQV